MPKPLKFRCVMKAQCPTCPFGPHGDPALREKVSKRCLNEASQICHHPRTKGKKETHLCRGARDLQLQLFYIWGVIAAPTDEAWEEAWKKMSADYS
jgi:hypothetical protein